MPKTKAKRGADHHWYKAEEDKVAPKPYVPTGKPRGRPKKAEEDKAPRYVPTGKPRGRPKMAVSEKKQSQVTSGKPRGRPKKTEAEE